MLDKVSNNTFYRNTISSLAIGILFNGTNTVLPRVSPNVYSNTFTNDTIIPCTTGCASNYNDIVLTANATDITFTNVSMNKSRIAIVPRSPDAPVEKNNLTIQWYLSVNVTNSSKNNPIANALVVINDSFALNIFAGTTDSTGGIPTQIVTEFTMNGSVTFTTGTDTCTDVRNNINITCFSPYNISVNITGYSTADRSIDVNRSKFLNISLTIVAAVTNTAPKINVSNATFTVTLAAASDVRVLISFNVTDADGAGDINASTAVVNFTLGIDGQYYANESALSTSEFGTCFNHSPSGTVVVINCTVVLPYFANQSSAWAVNISVKDRAGAVGRNDTVTFTISTLSSLSLPYAAINFSSVFLNQQDVAANLPLILNNTGNDDFDEINISAAALFGTTVTSENIGVAQFYANVSNAVAGLGRQLEAKAVTLNETTGTNANLIHGHTRAFAPNADKGNRSIFFWVDVPASGLSSQLYNATWNVTVINIP